MNALNLSIGLLSLVNSALGAFPLPAIFRPKIRDRETVYYPVRSVLSGLLASQLLLLFAPIAHLHVLVWLAGAISIFALFGLCSNSLSVLHDGICVRLWGRRLRMPFLQITKICLSGGEEYHRFRLNLNCERDQVDLLGFEPLHRLLAELEEHGIKAVGPTNLVLQGRRNMLVTMTISVFIIACVNIWIALYGVAIQ